MKELHNLRSAAKLSLLIQTSKMCKDGGIDCIDAVKYVRSLFFMKSNMNINHGFSVRRVNCIDNPI